MAKMRLLISFLFLYLFLTYTSEARPLHGGIATARAQLCGGSPCTQEWMAIGARAAGTFPGAYLTADQYAMGRRKFTTGPWGMSTYMSGDINFYMTTAGDEPIETTPGNNLVIEYRVIEYPLGTVAGVVKWSGSTTTTIASGGYVYSDALTLNTTIPPNTSAYEDTCYYVPSSGNKMVEAQLAINRTNQGGGATDSEGEYLGNSDICSTFITATTITPSVLTTTGGGSPPASSVILAQGWPGTMPVIGMFGDSVLVAAADYGANGTLARGYAERGLSVTGGNGPYAFWKAAVSGSAPSGECASSSGTPNWNLRDQFIKGAPNLFWTTDLVEHGANDRADSSQEFSGVMQGTGGAATPCGSTGYWGWLHGLYPTNVLGHDIKIVGTTITHQVTCGANDSTNWCTTANDQAPGAANEGCEVTPMIGLCQWNQDLTHGYYNNSGSQNSYTIDYPITSPYVWNIIDLRGQLQEWSPNNPLGNSYNDQAHYDMWVTDSSNTTTAATCTKNTTSCQYTSNPFPAYADLVIGCNTATLDPTASSGAFQTMTGTAPDLTAAWQLYGGAGNKTDTFASGIEVCDKSSEDGLHPLSWLHAQAGAQITKFRDGTISNPEGNQGFPF